METMTVAAAIPLVSVIIPAFNAASFISTALESVLAQTLSTIEVIVVDDASSDDTCQIVSRYATQDARVRLLQNVANSGPAYSRNRGISAAKAAWIALLDADDWYDVRRLECLWQYANQHAVDFVADDLWRIEQGAKQPFGRLFPENYIQTDWMMLTVDEYLLRNPSGKNNTFGLLKPLLRRSFLQDKAISYNERLRLGEDFFLYLEMLAAGARAILIAEPYYYYVSRQGSLTQIRNYADLERMLAGLELTLQSVYVRQQKELLQQLEARQSHMRHYQLPLFSFLSSLKTRQFFAALQCIIVNPQISIEVIRRIYQYVLKKD